MKRTAIILITIITTAMAMAQNQQLIYPETYIETSLDAATLKTMSKNFSIDKVTRNADGTFNTRIYLSYKDFDNFLSLNIPFTTAPRSRAYVQMAHNYAQMTTDWNRYPTYSTYTAMMDTFRTRYPQLCDIDTILDDTPTHHKILVAHISNNLNDREGKPSVFYTSSIHGDEVVGYYMMLRMIDYLLTNYNTDTFVTELINSTDIWICPLHNPDGTYYSGDNILNESPTSIRSNRHGVDLNRSFPWVGNPAKENEDEPEVQAMMAFLQSHNFTLAANFHGGDEVFNYPWDFWISYEHSHADADWWYLMGRKFADTCHNYSPYYMRFTGDNGVTEGGDWYVITGSMQDWHNWYLGTRHVTIEVSSDKVVASNRLPNYWNYISHSLLNFIAEAGNGVHGTVTDSLTGEPLEALIHIANHDLDHSFVETTLPYGDYHRPIKGGQYAITYSANGYLPKTITTQVADGERLVQNVQLTKTVGIEDYESRLATYPNPAKDFVTVELHGTEIGSITLYDIQGRSRVTYRAQTESFTIDLSTIPAGIYILHIKVADGQDIFRKLTRL